MCGRVVEKESGRGSAHTRSPSFLRRSRGSRRRRGAWSDVKDTTQLRNQSRRTRRNDFIERALGHMDE
jgi:hypothetical protein